MLILRDLASQIQAAFREAPSVTLAGPRQSGKTTLLKNLFPEATDVHLEEPDVLDFARRDPRGFVQAHREPVIFDEVQYSPELLPYIKAEIDRHRTRRGRFLLTGSQSFALLDSMTESLAGRTVYVDLLPLSAAEARARVRSDSVADLIFRGFYPELHASTVFATQDSVARWQASHIRTFVERDVRRISNVGDLNQFERFLRLSAARTAQLLNLAELGRDTCVDQSTARRWHSVSVLRTFPPRLLRSIPPRVPVA